MTKSHKFEPIFVGREDELKRFGEVLASPKGQAVLRLDSRLRYRLHSWRLNSPIVFPRIGHLY